MQHISAKGVWLFAGMLAAIALTAWLYAPGLSGPFVFDDFANLPALGAQGPVSDSASLLRYLTSGKADPTGRPLAMASFLVEAHDWPSDPFPFKRDNLILHLMNGALLALLLSRLGSHMGLDEKRARFATGFGAMAWMVHPLFVSTVLYVVQREAMLPATFALLSLLTWLHGRRAALLSGRFPIAAYVGAYLFAAMATLSKANGLLIPLLIVCVEATLPASGKWARKTQRWTWFTFGPMAALVAGGLVWSAIANLGAGPIPVRGWSVDQRLMTEPTIILDYLARLTLVVPPTSSLFHDSYRAATGLFSPWYTLPSMAVCTAIIVTAFLARQRYRVAAAAVIFFFAAHAMESSALSLELYFEHRNYLPAMLLFWPVGYVVYQLPGRYGKYVAAAALLTAGAGMTYVNVAIWSDPLRQARVWAAIEPNSPRAQAYAAQVEAGSGDLGHAIARIDAAAKRFPSEPQVAYTRVDLHCMEGVVGQAMLSEAETALRTSSRDPGELVSRWFQDAVGTAVAGRCEGLTLDAVAAMTEAAAANPAISILPGRRQDLNHVRGVIALARGAPDEALQYFNRALMEAPGAAIALNQAAALGAAGQPSLGLQHLGYFDALAVPEQRSPASGMRWMHAVVLEHQGYWQGEINHLRSELQRHEKGQE